MLYLKSFCFNPFQENTYLVYDENNTAFIIDPGNSDADEDKELMNFITEKKLNLTRLLLTHAHIDHILGNDFILEEYGLYPEVHTDDVIFIERMTQSAAMYGVQCNPSALPKKLIADGDKIMLGKYEFLCIHTPGHSPGSICFYNRENKILIGGDVLFNGSIGRSDLPRGDHETLIRSIREKILTLGNDIRVYPGHGPHTITGYEEKHNPFLT